MKNENDHQEKEKSEPSVGHEKEAPLESAKVNEKPIEPIVKDDKESDQTQVYAQDLKTEATVDKSEQQPEAEAKNEQNQENANTQPQNKKEKQKKEKQSKNETTEKKRRKGR